MKLIRVRYYYLWLFVLCYLMYPGIDANNLLTKKNRFYYA
jgi:hypothetical protein